MSSIKTLAIMASVTMLAACEPAGPRLSQSESPDVPANTTASPAKKVPRPVEMFEAYCYRVNADYKRVVAMAAATDLPRASKKLDAILGAEVGGGMSFMIVNNEKEKRMMLLGVSDQNTCSIFAQGYGVEAIKESMRENYRLKLISKDDLGLQVNEMHIPGGTKGTVGEGSQFGLIALTYAKDPAVDQITLAFLPPETAKKVFSQTQ